MSPPNLRKRASSFSMHSQLTEISSAILQLREEHQLLKQEIRSLLSTLQKSEEVFAKRIHELEEDKKINQTTISSFIHQIKKISDENTSYKTPYQDYSNSPSTTLEFNQSFQNGQQLQANSSIYNA